MKILICSNICPIKSEKFWLKVNLYIREQYFKKGLAGNDGTNVLFYLDERKN